MPYVLQAACTDATGPWLPPSPDGEDIFSGDDVYSGDGLFSGDGGRSNGGWELALHGAMDGRDFLDFFRVR